uniref:Mobile element protein n=1 Tax=Klebsiella pneumoniae TaxID=573 RepID=A0A6G9HZW1_KLEPN|nr:Mobile element protein [Klebsiella pneumoniae]QIQ16297.1 Mobile element protein [Klebsiella pneumoniae]
MRGGNGQQITTVARQRYSDLAITTVLVIKRVFRLTLRAAQGFIDSIFSLMNVPLRCPDYSCVSRRAKFHRAEGLW